MLGRFADRFGRLIWSQTRDIQVQNYEKHILYSIYENGKYIHVAVNKSNDKVEWTHLQHLQKPSTFSDRWNKMPQQSD